MIAGAVTGILGTRKISQSPMLLSGVLGFALGLSAFLAEKARYSIFDRKEVEENLEAASKTADLILETKQPFGFQNPSPVSPEYADYVAHM